MTLYQYLTTTSYGYRGKDCRDNLFILPATGELVYNMAGVVVLYDYNTNKQRHYTEHSDDVKWYVILLGKQLRTEVFH